MANSEKILVVLPTVALNHRRNLEGFLHYAHEKCTPAWQYHLELGDLAQQGLKNIGKWGCTGIVAVTNGDAERRRYLATGLPAVLIDPTITSAAKAKVPDNVVIFFNDHEAEGVTAAEYFLKRGYTSFAYVGTPNPVPWSTARGRGFAKRLARDGFRVRSYPAVPPAMRDDFSQESERLATWLARLPNRTAVFVVHDRRAQQVIATAVNAGLDVPRQLAVLGVDDDRLICENTTPAISSIPVHPEEVGRQYAEALHELLKGQRPSRYVRTRHTEVVTRASTDTNAISDPFVSRAMRAIEGDLGSDLGLGRLAAIAGCSRRTLQLRFRRTLGCTLSEAIAAARLAAARQMLDNTDRSVEEIARTCGFCTVSHLGQRLRETTGLGPRDFRKRKRTFQSS